MTDAPSPRVLMVPVELTQDMQEDLQRFHETCEDGQEYDVPQDRMKGLARAGLIRHVGKSRYEFTTIGAKAVQALSEDYSDYSGLLVLEPVAWADAMAFANFKAGISTHEWMWSAPDTGLVALHLGTPLNPVNGDQS